MENESPLAPVVQKLSQTTLDMETSVGKKMLAHVLLAVIEGEGLVACLGTHHQGAIKRFWLNSRHPSFYTVTGLHTLLSWFPFPPSVTQSRLKTNPEL